MRTRQAKVLREQLPDGSQLTLIIEPPPDSARPVHAAEEWEEVEQSGVFRPIVKALPRTDNVVHLPRRAGGAR